MKTKEINFRHDPRPMISIRDLESLMSKVRKMTLPTSIVEIQHPKTRDMIRFEVEKKIVKLLSDCAVVNKY